MGGDLGSELSGAARPDTAATPSPRSAAAGPVAAAIVLAGGSGSRLRGAGSRSAGSGDANSGNTDSSDTDSGVDNKVFLPLGGRPVVAWSLELFAAVAAIGPVVLVVRSADLGLAAALGDRYGAELVVGGADRQASESAGLAALAARIESGEIDVVAVHDAARPFADRDLVERVLATAREVGGAVPGVLREDLHGWVGAATGPGAVGGVRPGLLAAQTPQAFRALPLLAAYRAAAPAAAGGAAAVTDTAACVAQHAPTLTVRAVPAQGRNFKITYGHELAVARALSTGPWVDRVDTPRTA